MPAMLIETEVWPDEIQTLEVLSETARGLGGALVAQGSGHWLLDLPGVEPLGVQLSGEAPFPLWLSAARGPGFLLGGADHPELLRQVLSGWCGAPGPLLDLAELTRGLAGWRTFSGSASVVELARVDQARSGWPAVVQLQQVAGTALLRVDQGLNLAAPACAWAVEHYLARWMKQGVILLIREYSKEAQSTSGFSHQVQYQLSLPAGLLSKRLLEAALTLLSCTFLRHAPALQALANHPTLSRAYFICNRSGDSHE